MAEVQKIQSSGNGLSIQHGAPTAPTAPELPAGSKAGIGGTVRVKADGSIEHEGVYRSSDAPVSSADPFDSGVTQTGFRRARHQLTQDDLVMHEGMQTRIRELVSLGFAEPDPAGGFRMKAQPPVQEQPREQQQDTPKMERLSESAEATISTIVGKLGDANAIAIVRQIAEGKEMPAAGEYASRLGVEPHEFSEMVSRTADEYRGQAMRALGMDAETYAEFSQWAMQNDPGTTREAVLNAFDRSDYKLARQLAERFQREGASRWTDEELAEIPLGNGGESVAMSKDERRRPLITIPGYGTMLLRAAIQQKLVSVRRG